MSQVARGQLSLRPSARTLDGLRRRARLLGQKHTVLAERSIAEGLLMDEHPGIHFVDGPMGRRPAVVGTGLDVWEIITVAKDNGGSVEETAAYLEIDPRLVETATRRRRGEVACRPGRSVGLRLLLDEHLSPEIARQLRARGHDVVAVGERSDLRGRSDRVQFASLPELDDPPPG